MKAPALEAPVVARRSAVPCACSPGRSGTHSPLLVSGLPSYLTEDKVRGHKPLVSPCMSLCISIGMVAALGYIHSFGSGLCGIRHTSGERMS